MITALIRRITDAVQRFALSLCYPELGLRGHTNESEDTES